MATEEGVAAARVVRWMQQVGAESLGDLAFYFSSFQEALDNAGRAVADAWLSARQNVQVGLAGQVRAQSGGSCGARCSQCGRLGSICAGAYPVCRQAFRQVRAPRGRGGGLAAGRHHDQTVLREASRSRTTDATRFKNLLDIARSVSAKAEKATLRRAATTWRELRAAAVKRGAAVHSLDAHAVAEVVRTRPGPARARQALLWMQKNLFLDLDLALPKVKRSQAHVPWAPVRRRWHLQGVLLRIDDLLTSTREQVCTSSVWISAFGAWSMAVGVVRFRHLQRSIIAQVFDTHLVFLCRKGKQANQRFGFHWSLPRRTPTGLDLWPLLDRLQRLLAKKACFLKQLVVHPVDLKPISPNGMLQNLNLQSILDDTVVADLTSYSPLFCRELAGLDATQGAALGNWVERNKTQALSTVHHSVRLKFVLQEALFRRDEWSAILPSKVKAHMDSGTLPIAFSSAQSRSL